ncbi:MAG: hypothetical protein CEN91_493, partial [Candidatus Berkelbacteria bacterium Licking1014_85]
KIDPIVIRLAFVVLTLLLDGLGVVIYVILAILIPDKGVKKTDINSFQEETQNIAQELKKDAKILSDKKDMVAVLLILIGVVSAIGQIFPSFSIDITFIWPVIFIIYGAYLLIKNDKK